MAAQSRSELRRWPLPLPARFLKSSTRASEAPPPDKPEFIFMGRSNVGKSSLLNALAGRKNLARISSQPGKTKLLNHFEFNHAWYFTDVPGYGYARASLKERQNWAAMINGYLNERPNLALVCLLVDISVPWQTSDKKVMEGLEQSGLNWMVVFTKYDKLPRSRAVAELRKREQELREICGRSISCLAFSSVQWQYRDALLDFIHTTAQSWYKAYAS